MRLLTFFLFISSCLGQGWVVPFPASLDEVYASDQGTGDGTTRDNPDSLADSITNATAGRTVWLLPGTYYGTFVFNTDGTAANLIIYRCTKWPLCIIDGHVQREGDYNVFWDLVFQDPDGSEQNCTTAAYLMDQGNGDQNAQYIINSLFRDAPNQAIASFSRGPENIVGNIFDDIAINYHVSCGGSDIWHAIYLSNDSATIKHVAQNLFSSIIDDHSIHGYTETVDNMQNVWYEENMLAGSSTSIASMRVAGTKPAFNITVNKNYFGYSVLSTAFSNGVMHGDITNNYWALRCGDMGGFTKLWGLNVGICSECTQQNKPDGNNITDNTFIQECASNGPVTYDCQFFDGANAVAQCTGFDPADTVDNNSYQMPDLKITEGINSTTSTTMAGWRTTTSNLGNEFDTNSTFTDTDSSPPSNDIFIIDLDYGHNRCHFIIFNHETKTSENIDPSSVGCLSTNVHYKACAVTDPLCEAGSLSEGIYAGGNIAIDVTGLEVLAGVVWQDKEFGGGILANKRSRGRR